MQLALSGRTRHIRQREENDHWRGPRLTTEGAVRSFKTLSRRQPSLFRPILRHGAMLSVSIGKFTLICGQYSYPVRLGNIIAAKVSLTCVAATAQC